uniref:Uncharacterized protein n=1 Tax=Anguilla anguilla TaxID=7936 RepID=A0A0E9WFQ5_ANGAN
MYICIYSPVVCILMLKGLQKNFRFKQLLRDKPTQQKSLYIVQKTPVPTVHSLLTGRDTSEKAKINPPPPNQSSEQNLNR